MDHREYDEMCERAEKMFEKHLKVILEELEKSPKPNKDAIEMILDGLEFIDMHMRRRQRGGGGRDYEDRERGGYDRERERGYERNQGGYRQGGWNGSGMGGMNGWNGGQQQGGWM